MIWSERIKTWLTEKPIRYDATALLMLTLLWAFYFWRALTPNPANQVSLLEGDFSGQFVAFGGYQASRLMAGEIPLWNPYNNAGHPFIADTQSAVFYPPRLLTIVISHIFFSGWSYAALQAETIAHYWLGALWMYLFVRTAVDSRVAGMVSAITLAYGGYLAGYPPLQLAVLESGIWLPLGLLGVFKASQPNTILSDEVASSTSPQEEEGHLNKWRIEWLSLSAVALGFSLLAGHPQTSLFFIYAIMAYTIHRAVRRRIAWVPTVLSAIWIIALGFGLAAVQILPGLEYARLTTRAGYGFDALAGGFPFSDLIVFLLPNVVSAWAPLYSGITALALAGVALWNRKESARFWGIVAIVALGISFGGATIFYHLAYLIAPGFSTFRGQERMAYLIAHSIAIMAGLGVSALQRQQHTSRNLVNIMGVVAIVAWAVTFEVDVIDWISPVNDLFALQCALVLLAILTTLTWALVGRLANKAQGVWWTSALIGLIVFDLFSTTMGTSWEPVPANDRELYDTNLVQVVLNDRSLFRVEGQVGLGANYGTLIGLQDTWGVSPLRLETFERYWQLPQYRRHEILAVKYVFTNWEQLEVPSSIRATSQDKIGRPLYLHEIHNPMPRSWMAYYVMVAPDDEQALGWLADPGFDPYSTVILEAEPELDLPEETPADWQVSVEQYAPEQIVLAVETPTDGVLVLSEMDYPGWQAMIDGQQAKIWRADAGLRALPLTSGKHRIEFNYRPLTVKLGGIGSIFSVTILLTAGVIGSYVHKAKRGGTTLDKVIGLSND